MYGSQGNVLDDISKLNYQWNMMLVSYKLNFSFASQLMYGMCFNVSTWYCNA